MHEYTPPAVDSGSDSAQIAAQLDTGSSHTDVLRPEVPTQRGKPQYTPPAVDSGSDSTQIAD